MNIQKIIKKYNTKMLAYIGIMFILLLISLIAFIYYYKKENNSSVEPVDYNSLISLGQDKEDEFVTVDIVDIPYEVAEREVNYSKIKYYILFDKDNYMYVAKLSDKTFKKISNAYEKNSDNFSYTLTGYIYNTPVDLKKIIIDVFNEDNDKKITLDDYSDYFGNTYLDDTYTIYTTQLAISELGLIFFGGVFIVFSICFVKYLLSTNKNLQLINQNEVDNELILNNFNYYKKAEIYLTNNYLIFVNKGVHIIKYNDIGWIYIGNHNGRLMNKKYLSIFLKNKNKYKSMKISNYEVFDQIINDLSNKNLDTVFGYSYENLQRYNEMTNRR